ncbi:RluA family pseudouridine synthase [Haliangium ochraceum]|uniref:Pseudouridine synthase n=1 Tax=Haliangium ochraceum (strain DSM 14365 / JCM 11303 / SMP-2) TaxID=502025 RepID=D0LKF5_HALO1|nr:RluA family pseudouridine synthase [Haliangium ochraceum]ACY15003.1 pseudouridine synthase, RluA family [Haliangium ochraceum DSM 14365]
MSRAHGETRRFRFAPGPDDEPRARLDQFLTACELALSRSQVKRLIDEGAVQVDGAEVRKPGFKLQGGEAVEVALPAPQPLAAEPQAIPLDICYEDEHIIVVDKPAGLVVHPAPGHPDGTLVNALLAHCHDLSGIGGALRPGIVHRLDKDTSGVMVATKTEIAHHAMVETFQAHRLERAYLAVVAPPPEPPRGTISTLHGRHPVHRKKFSGRVSRGKQAITQYRVERVFGRLAAEVRCQLETGRTHQIRVHLSEMGAPLIGDVLYGRRYRDGVLAPLARALGRQALHATLLAFAHPVTGAPLRFERPPPADMQTLIEALAARV